MRRMTGNGGGHGTVRAEKLLPKTKRTEGTSVLTAAATVRFPWLSCF